MGVALEKVEDFSPFILGNPKEFQRKAARLRSCSLSLSYYTLPPQSSFHGLLHREPMLRMQEGEGHSKLYLDRLQLEAIHKVRTLSLLYPSFSFSPNSGPVISEMGDEKVTETAEKGKQL